MGHKGVKVGFERQMLKTQRWVDRMIFRVSSSFTSVSRQYPTYQLYRVRQSVPASLPASWKGAIVAACGTTEGMGQPKAGELFVQILSGSAKGRIIAINIRWLRPISPEEVRKEDTVDEFYIPPHLRK